jgi:hypothetical protein
VFSKMSESASPSYKFVRLVFQCTGGGTLVPIFINLVPVSLSTDAYPIAIAISYLLHTYTPILREVLNQSELLKVSFVTRRATEGRALKGAWWSGLWMMASLRPEGGASYKGVVAGVVDGCLCPPSRVN